MLVQAMLEGDFRRALRRFHLTPNAQADLVQRLVALAIQLPSWRYGSDACDIGYGFLVYLDGEPQDWDYAVEPVAELHGLVIARPYF